MLQNTKKVFKIQLKRSVIPISVEEAQISASGANCGDALPNTAYVATQVSGTITNGDIVYSDSGATTLFDGGGLNYLLSLDGGINVHSVTISSIGVVTYIELCVVGEREPVRLSIGGTLLSTDCGDTTIENTFLDMQTTFPTVGDIMYEDDTTFTVYNGGGQYFIMERLSNSQKYKVQIQTDGEILIDSICF